MNVELVLPGTVPVAGRKAAHAHSYITSASLGFQNHWHCKVSAGKHNHLHTVSLQSNSIIIHCNAISLRLSRHNYPVCTEAEWFCAHLFQSVCHHPTVSPIDSYKSIAFILSLQGIKLSSASPHYLLWLSWAREHVHSATTKSSEWCSTI